MAFDVPIQAAQTPQAAPSAAPAAGDASSSLDSFVKQFGESPLVQGIKQGKPAAVYAPPALFGDNAEHAIAVIEHAAPHLGLDMVQAPKSSVYVLFNPELVKKDTILQADAAGSLDQVATSAESLGQDGSPAAPTSPAGETPSPAGTPPQNVSGGLLPAGAQDDAMRARIGTLTPKPPTKQTLPSQGIVNGLVARAQ